MIDHDEQAARIRSALLVRRAERHLSPTDGDTLITTDGAAYLFVGGRTEFINLAMPIDPRGFGARSA